MRQTKTHFAQLFCIKISLIIAIGLSIANSEEIPKSPKDAKAFSDYWYQGKAELSRYTLKQARYGEIHEGDAVLIFVTEDFFTDKQVKFEHGNRGPNVTSVLKLNATRKFNTGIYPYSMMTSVFTPVKYGKDNKTLKLTASSQEWCGHTFMQANNRNSRFEGFINSYFQAEEGQTFSLDQALLEDAIWSLIRLNPDLLPVGDITLIPGFHYARLRHYELAIEKATAELRSIHERALSEKALKAYHIEYKSIERVLEIKFQAEFPYEIIAWEEKYPSGFGNSKWLSTTATRTHSIMAPYWEQHDVADSVYRKQLGL